MSARGIAAGVTLGLSWLLLLVFFVTKKAWIDRLSGVFGLVFPPLVFVVVLDVHRMYVDDTSLFWVATVIAGAGLVATFVANAAVLLAGVNFDRMALLATAGAIGMILWPGAVGWAAVRYGGLPAPLAWSGVVVVGLTLVALVPWVKNTDLLFGRRELARLELAIGAPVIVAVPAWFIWLGASL